jgi:hypothetical protein
MINAMKVLFKSDSSGWVNFGTNYQAWEDPFTIEVSEKTGKVYKRTKKSTFVSEGCATVEKISYKKELLKSPTEYKLGGKYRNKYTPLNMTEKEANEVYFYLA